MYRVRGVCLCLAAYHCMHTYMSESLMQIAICCFYKGNMLSCMLLSNADCSLSVVRVVQRFLQVGVAVIGFGHGR